MHRSFRGWLLASTLLTGLTFGVTSCNWNRSSNSASDEEQRQRDEKTREDVAKATETLKPALEAAGRKLGEASERAAEDARAAAQGVKEGWSRGGHNPVDLNSASEKELTEVSGISISDARRIIRARPYRNKRELISKGILSSSRYLKIEDQIVVK